MAQKRPIFQTKQSFIKCLGKMKLNSLLWGSQNTVNTYFAIAFNCVKPDSEKCQVFLFSN